MRQSVAVSQLGDIYILPITFQAVYLWIGRAWIVVKTKFGLLLVVPLLIVALTLVRRDSVRGLLLWLGVLGYGIYNYAYYMLGASLNVFFLLYVVFFVLSMIILILALSRTDAAQVAANFPAKTPSRFIGGYFVFVAIGLSLVSFGLWAAYIFTGRPTPVETEAFKLVAALDTAIMVHLMALAGILLWRRNAWGNIIAGIQSSLYLLVLSVNSAVAIFCGLIEAPGELPI